MVLSIVILLICFYVGRFIAMRFPGSTLVANILAAAIVVAFVIGSLVRPFGGQTATVASVDTPAATVQPAAATPAPATSVAPARIRDVSGECSHLPAAPNAGGIGSFDVLAAGTNGTTAIAQGASMGRNQEYVALGWGADDDRQSPAVAVCLLVDGKVALRAKSLYGAVRPDVAQALNAPGLGDAGFKILIPPGSLPAGAHTLAVAILSKDKSFRIAPNFWNVVER